MNRYAAVPGSSVYGTGGVAEEMSGRGAVCAVFAVAEEMSGPVDVEWGCGGVCVECAVAGEMSCTVVLAVGTGVVVGCCCAVGAVLDIADDTPVPGVVVWPRGRGAIVCGAAEAGEEAVVFGSGVELVVSCTSFVVRRAPVLLGGGVVVGGVVPAVGWVESEVSASVGSLPCKCWGAGAAREVGNGELLVESGLVVSVGGGEAATAGIPKVN